MAQKKYMVKLNVPSTFLESLPAIASPSRARTKKGTATVSSEASKASSPSPAGGKNATGAAKGAVTKNGGNIDNNNLSTYNANNSKINSGLRESSTSGLTMNSIATGSFSLDKTRKASKKWAKRPTQFKTFSGFKVKYFRWKQKDTRRESKATSNATAGSVSKEEKSAKLSEATNPLEVKQEA